MRIICGGCKKKQSQFLGFFSERLRGQLGQDHPHVVAMAAEEKLFRVRPADVAGAGNLPSRSWPVGFDLARAEGIALLQAAARA
jgi:hypothetical protein